MSASAYAQKEQELNLKAKQWLENLLGLEVEDDFFVALGDGVLLCSIVNTIKPGTIPKVFSAARCKKIVSKRLDNINSFVAGARRIGVFQSYMFDVAEFAAGKRQDKLVKTLLKLEELAKKAGIDPSQGACGNVLELRDKIEEDDRKKQEAIEAEKAAAEKAAREAHEQYLRDKDERKKQETELRAQKERERKLLEESLAKLSLEDAEKRNQLQAKIDADKAQEEERIKQTKEKKKVDEAARQERLKKDKEDRDRRMEELKKQAAPPPASAAPKTYSGSDAILYWAKNRVEDYGIEVKNFTTSWKDGLAFCALVHSYFPKNINFDACKSKTPNERLAIAFDVAGQQGVPPLLDPEDITEIPTPDKRSMMTYLSCLYKGFKR